MIEMMCDKCKESFVVSEPTDDIHLVKGDGTLCGGTGVMKGEWSR